jgi:hypothetical protein
MSKITALQLFAITLYEKGLLTGNGDLIQEILELHKEMEKEQMIDFAKKYEEYCYNSFQQNRYVQVKNAEQYYNETYGGNE